MTDRDHHGFELLKQEIATCMQRTYPGINPSISTWKGQDIVNFQEELLVKVNGNLSEKWFYTHIKSHQASLPRIDVLNLLSKYAGYSDWDDFLFRHKGQSSPVPPSKKANRVFILVPALLILISAILFGFFKLFQEQEYRFCFYDADTKEPITNSIIEITLLLDGESPVNYLCSPDGCFQLKTEYTQVRFVVQTPYYHADTIIRQLDKFHRNERVKLRVNSYAMMLNYFSRKNVKDWQQRRLQLDQMIADSAIIYQVFSSGAGGMELYSKWEFINKLTMPSASLKDLEILDSKYTGGKLSLLRFRQKQTK